MKIKTTVFCFAIALSLLLGACTSREKESTGNSATSAPQATSAPIMKTTQNSVSDTASLAEEPDDHYDGQMTNTANMDIARSESYLQIEENSATSTSEESMLTFSLKVDTASYSNVQRYIESGLLPPVDAVRTEELINYFGYDGELAITDGPFGIYTEVGPSPFDTEKQMAFIRVRTKDIDPESLQPSNLTFLIDTSGSMDSFDKLPLLKEAFTLLVETLGENDRVSIVTYAGNSAIVLDSVNGADKNKIIKAINNLEAGGSTAGADGIHTAYKLAEKNFRQGGNNRVILATDGDFNVGISDVTELEEFISEKRDTGVYLSVLGFGTGNIRDDIMETLSKSGNGNYSYINSVQTAKKVLVNEMGSNMFTVADDVKAQVEFNPRNVKSYRLIGYENRRLSNRDFDDDTKDAGEIGIGTDVVVMFELELQGDVAQGKKYSEAQSSQSDEEFGDELFEVRIRYKNPGESASNLLTRPVTLGDIVDTASTDYQFACSVAAFGHLLRGSGYAGKADIGDIIEMAEHSAGADADGYRREYLAMLRAYQDMME